MSPAQPAPSGVGRVVRAAPDGYTISIGHWQTHVVNGATYTISFDLVRDLEPVALVADCPMWIVANTAFPARDLNELIVWLKENPGKATVGIAGVGGGADVVGTYFQEERHQLSVRAVQGRRADDPGPRRRQMDLPSRWRQVRSRRFAGGQLKPYAVMAERRWWATPDTPIID